MYILYHTYYEPTELFASHYSDGLWTDNIAILSVVCCQLEEFIKISLYNVNGNLINEATSLPSGGRISSPRDVTSDPFGNIILSDGDLGTFVLSEDLKQVG